MGYPILFILISIFIFHGEARPPANEFSSYLPNSHYIPGVSKSQKLDPSKIYILRRKVPKQKLTQTSISIPIVPEEPEIPEEGPNGWVSLEQAFTINKALQTHNQDNKRPFTITSIELEAEDRSSEERRLPIMVDGSVTSEINRFKGNINLPTNPFVTQQVENKRLHSTIDNQRERLRDLLSSLEQTRTPSSHYSKQKKVQATNNFPQQTSATDANSRADSFFPFSSLSSFLKPKSKKTSYKRPASSFYTAHYTKPGSSQEFRGQYFDESRKSVVKVPLVSNRDTFASLLTKLKHVQQIKEAFPPHGSYTPYGERTIIMVKYPGLPERKRVGGIGRNVNVGSFGRNIFKIGGIKPISLSQDNWSSSSSHSLKIKDSDFGVIISQNYILQPDASMNSPYNHDENSNNEDIGSQNPGDLVSELAKALQERNQIINSYSSSGKKVDKQPPFVLVHLETFTKKTNKSTNFGFDENIEINYANGTIIYPTLSDPAILASTKFEFDNVHDIENVFDRPFQAYQRGGMRPVVPLGMVDIQNYLRLLYEVHKDIHESGKGKVEELKGLSYVVDKQLLPGSRPLADWELKNSQGRYKDNWLHTSTIGLRSLSDYPQPPTKLPIPYPLK